jgi:hypothetical protein
VATLAIPNGDSTGQPGAADEPAATPTPAVRTATPTGAPVGPTVLPTPADDYAAVALATGNVRDDTAAVLTAGQPVDFTCHEAQAWERPSFEEMSETFAFYRFGNGEHPYPGLYTLYLSDVLYQAAPWANSANIEFGSMSGLGGGNDRSRAAPQLCPVRDRADHETTMPQAVYLVGLRPLVVLERDGHAVVVAEADPGVLHKVAFERPICCPGKDGPTPFGRMDVVTTDGWLRFVQTGGDKWQADGGGHLDFVLVGSQVGGLPGDLPLPEPFDAYASDVEWHPIEPGFRPPGATVGNLVQSPLHLENPMLFLPAGSPVP